MIPYQHIRRFQSLYEATVLYTIIRRTKEEPFLAPFRQKTSLSAGASEATLRVPASSSSATQQVSSAQGRKETYSSNSSLLAGSPG